MARPKERKREKKEQRNRYNETKERQREEIKIGEILLPILVTKCLWFVIRPIYGVECVETGHQNSIACVINCTLRGAVTVADTVYMRRL